MSHPIPFILASTDQGLLILNRHDIHQEGNRVFGVGAEILRDGAFCADEVDLALKLLELRRALHGDGVVAVDCGANIGVHAVTWSRGMTGWGRVIAIEAQERIYYALAGNIAVNNCFNATAVHAAVGEVDGVMEIPVPDYFRSASFGSLELKPRADAENIGQVIDYRREALTPVRAVRLDSLGLARVDLIKIDVEGMELEVLGGAAGILAAAKPLLLIETGKCDSRKLAERLQALGYRIHQTGGMNLLAIHPDDPASAHILDQGAPPA